MSWVDAHGVVAAVEDLEFRFAAVREPPRETMCVLPSPENGHLAVAVHPLMGCAQPEPPEKFRRGDSASWSKVTSNDVRAIRAAFAAGARPVDLGRRYGISHAAVWHIVKRDTWKHVA